MAERDVVFPATGREFYDTYRYAPAIRANGFLFVSGQVGNREDGSPEPEIEAQVRLAFQNLLAVLAGAGGTFDDVLDVTMFLTQPEADFETVMRVLNEFWGEAPHPTLTAVGVTWLYGFRFEVKVIARLPEGDDAA